MRNTHTKAAFTLVELLVVIGIIALLISILLPALSAARKQAKTVTNLSNLRQLGLGLVQYRIENKGVYPVAAWNKFAGRARLRWADAIYPYMKNTEVYMSPHLDEQHRQRMKKPFFHTTTGLANDGTEILPTTRFWGGYGYNWQYLGNGRLDSAGKEYFAKHGAQVRVEAQTIALADTDGCKDGYDKGEGVYVIDPPLGSLNFGSKGSRKSASSYNSYYQGGSDGQADYRATPAERNNGKVGVLYCDGHCDTRKLKELDDFNGDGHLDNGYWNGKADATSR